MAGKRKKNPMGNWAPRLREKTHTPASAYTRAAQTRRTAHDLELEAEAEAAPVPEAKSPATDKGRRHRRRKDEAATKTADPDA